MIAQIDGRWLGADKHNFESMTEMIRRSAAFVEAMDSAAREATNVHLLVDEILVTAEPAAMSEDLIVDVTIAAFYGYGVAKCEAIWGWAKAGKTHPAAHCAVAMYPNSDSGSPGLLLHFAVRAGHFYGRTGLRQPFR
jgi:hypothetical protein